MSTPWKEVHDTLEKSKRYRKTLGSWLASSGKPSDKEVERAQPMKAFLEAAILVWPDIEKIEGAVPVKKIESPAVPVKRSASKQAADVGETPPSKRAKIGFGTE